MFRIKTDIREYECESEERVERLIRNWVIRPTDRIFHGDREEWGPIGEHPAFSETFAEMANREENVPETQVVEEEDGTEEDDEDTSSYTPDLSGWSDRVGDDAGEAVSSDPSVSASGGSAVGDTTESADETSGEVAAAEHARSTSPRTGSSAVGDTGESADETSGEAAAAEHARSTSPRTGSSAVGDTGESADETSGEAAAAEHTRSTSPRTGSSAVGDTGESVSTGASTSPMEELPATSARSTSDETVERGEATSRRNGSEASPGTSAEPDGFSVEVDTDVAPPSNDSDDDQVARSDLPEELLTTNEMSISAREQSEPPEIPSPTFDEEAVDAVSEAPVDEPDPAGSAPREHEARGRPDPAGSPPARSDAPNGSASTEPSTHSPDEIEAELQQHSRRGSASEEVDEDEWDAIMEGLRDTDELDKQELDRISETRDEITIGRDTPDGDGEVPDEIREYVSEGYDIELPVEIGPVAHDQRLGLPSSRASTSRKDRTFPRPSSKREDEVVRRDFVFETPNELPWFAIALFAGLSLLGFLVGLAAILVLFSL